MTSQLDMFRPSAAPIAVKATAPAMAYEMTPVDVLVQLADCANAEASGLIERYGSLQDVLRAALWNEPGFPEGMRPKMVAMHHAVTAFAETSLRGGEVINSWDKLVDYLRIRMANLPYEEMRVLWLDRKNCILASECLWTGTVDHAPIYPREVARRALEWNATAVIIAHCHPSGNPSPSSADIEATKRVSEALKTIGVTLHDHIIVGREGHTSLKSAGLI